MLMLLTVGLLLNLGPGWDWEAAVKRGPREAQLLELNPEARRWARRHIPARGAPESRLQSLAASLILEDGLDLQEDGVTRSALETFEARRSNCVGVALLFVALAREVGIPAYFVLSEGLEGRGRRGDLQIEELHVAAAFGDGDHRWIFDLGGKVEETAAFRRVSDRTVAGVFYSNRGAEQLQAGSLEEALETLSLAVEDAPDLSFVWINLGVARRRLGDSEGADDAFRQAILLAPDSLAAWRNLALLLDAVR